MKPHAHQFHPLDGLPDLEAVPPPKPIGRPQKWYPCHCPRCLWNWWTLWEVRACPHCAFDGIRVSGSPPKKPHKRSQGTMCTECWKWIPSCRVSFHDDKENAGNYVCDECRSARQRSSCSSPVRPKINSVEGDPDAFSPSWKAGN